MASHGSRTNQPPWLVVIIGELIDHAAEADQIPTHARRRMRLAPTATMKQELEQIDRLREPAILLEVRSALPTEFPLPPTSCCSGCQAPHAQQGPASNGGIRQKRVPMSLHRALVEAARNDLGTVSTTAQLASPHSRRSRF
jgi:hypothetical protein